MGVVQGRYALRPTFRVLPAPGGTQGAVVGFLGPRLGVLLLLRDTRRRESGDDGPSSYVQPFTRTGWDSGDGGGPCWPSP